MRPPVRLSRRPWSLFSFIAAVVALVAGGGSILAGSPASAQQASPDRPSAAPAEVRAHRLASHLSDQDRGRLGQRSKSRGAGHHGIVTRKLQQSSTNLVTRGAVGLEGTSYGSLSIADVDEDGNADFLITGTAGTILYLGKGDGRFSQADAGLVDVGSGAASSIADVDGDGHKDLLVVGDSESGPTATLYLGDGSGGFRKANAGLTGVFRSSTSIADVNEDGHLDLLITGITSATGGRPVTTLYLGSESGDFTEASAGLVDVYTGSTAIADLNGDDNLDILITGYSFDDFEPVTKLYHGDGNGGFSESGISLNDVDYSSTSVADVNGDGYMDLLITGEDKNSDPVTTLYLGNKNGGFFEASAGLAGVSSSGTSIADVDGDSHLDLLIAGESGGSTLYLGDGSGNFSTADAGLTPVSGAAAGIVDIDDDGDQDLLLTGKDPFFGASSRLYVNRRKQPSQNRDPQFERTISDQTLASGLTLSKRIEAGDIDGDPVSVSLVEGEPNVSLTDARNGIAELTVSPEQSQGGETIDVQIQVTDSHGATATFSVLVTIPAFMTARSAGLADVDGAASVADVDENGRADLLLTGEDADQNPTATLYLQDKSGGFSGAGADLTGVSYSSTSIADVNSDTHLDLLITGDDGSNPNTSLYLGNGNGDFSTAGAGLEDVYDGSTSIADVNDDGHMDLLIAGDEGPEPTTTLYLGNDSGGFSEAGANLTGVSDAATSIADVDDDGHLDLLITGSDADFNRTATLYLGDGTGSFSKSGAGLTGVVDGSTSIADVNGDGHKDLLIAGLSESTQTTTLYLGNGKGGFSEAGASLTGVAVASTAIGDANRDGHQDLLITGFDGDVPSATLYLGDGNGGFSQAEAGLAGVNSGSASMADLSGDGVPDLLVTGTGEFTSSSSTFFYENRFDDPLPVELAAFETALENKSVTLSWATVSETENAGFDVQRRVADSQSWTTLGFVEGSGTVSAPQSYRFIDSNLPYEESSVTYRLRQVDTDGETHLSETVTVERGAPTRLRLRGTSPNPVRQRATVRYAVPERADVTLRVYDVLGRPVKTVSAGKQKGRKEAQIDVSGLASGTYFLRLTAGSKTEVQKFTLVK